jgi:uncharacterized protein YndB with AHSA1/START domain
MKDFKKYYIIAAEPEEVYLALTRPLSIELWTGEPAEMSTEPGSEFSIFGASITGRNLEFEPDKKLVQEWYFEAEPETPSIVTIKLHPHEAGTSVEVRHTGIPDADYEDVARGWNETYMAGLADFF